MSEYTTIYKTRADALKILHLKPDIHNVTLEEMLDDIYQSRLFNVIVEDEETVNTRRDKHI